jgi:hypothetical protein
MVGDYISCSVSDRRAFALFAIGKPATAGKAFNEAMYSAGGLQIKGGQAKAVTGPIRVRRPTSPELSATVKLE